MFIEDDANRQVRSDICCLMRHVVRPRQKMEAITEQALPAQCVLHNASSILRARFRNLILPDHYQQIT